MPSPKFRDILFGPYEPDWRGMPRAENPGYLVDAAGVRPTPNGYLAIPLFTNMTSTTAVPGTAYGRIHAVQVGTTVSIWACTASFGPTDIKIHQTNDFGVNWSDVESASGVGLWPDFCQFDDLIIMTSLGFSTQSKSLNAAVGTDFALLAGSPPHGVSIARVRDHLVIAGLSTDEYSVQWGAIGNPEDWPTPGTADARSKQAGTQALPIELGVITKIVAGDKFALIFQQRGITRMTYVGGSAVYEFDTYERRIGTGFIENGSDNWRIPHPVVTVGGGRFVWVNSTSGIFMTDGFAVRKVSLGRYDSLFGGGSSNYSAAYDDRTGNALLIYAGNSSKYFLYNPDTDQMGLVADSSIRSICECPLLSGEKGILNISSSLTLQQQTSSTMETMSFQTGYIEIEPGHFVQMHGAHLLGPSTSSLTLSYKTSSANSDCDESQSGFTTMTAASRGQLKNGRAAAPYFSFRVSSAGNGNQVLRGIRVYYEVTGPSQ